MKNLLALIGLVVVVFAGVGWYCGWYKLNLTKSPDGNLEIQTEVNTNKVADDSSAFFQKMGKMVGEKARQDAQPAAAPGATPGPTPPSSAPAPAPDANPPRVVWPMSPTKPAGLPPGGP
jgi:hypothetical protein